MATDTRLGHRARRELKAVVRARRQPCALCGYPIDQALDRQAHPLGSVIDEWLPRNLGGDPLDPTNTVELHRLCNGMKGATWPVDNDLRERCRLAVRDLLEGNGRRLAIERNW